MESASSPCPVDRRMCSNRLECRHVLKTNGKPMNLHAFCVLHVRVASSFRRRHFCGSLISVGRCWCPEVGLGILDLTFFIFRCPEVGLEFSLLGVQRLD